MGPGQVCQACLRAEKREVPEDGRWDGGWGCWSPGSRSRGCSGVFPGSHLPAGDPQTNDSSLKRHFVMSTRPSWTMTAAAMMVGW